MHIAVIIFAVLSLLVTGLMGFKWRASSGLNILCKLFLLVMTFFAFVVIFKGRGTTPYLIMASVTHAGLCSMWSTDDNENVIVKLILAGLTLFGLILTLIAL